MQLARQSDSRPPAHAGGSDKKAKRSARAGTIAAIHITWAKIRRDLKGDKEELRDSRLAFMSQVLNREVTTSRGLTQAKLGRVLDAMRELERAPLLPGAEVVQSPKSEVQRPEAQAEIHHLATEQQAAVINKIFQHLGWGLEAIEGFLHKRYQVKSHRMLTPAQANSLTFILLRIVAAREIKNRDSNIQRVSNAMIRAEIPRLKQRLGIDQKSDVRGQQSEEEFDDEA